MFIMSPGLSIGFNLAPFRQFRNKPRDDDRPRNSIKFYKKHQNRSFKHSIKNIKNFDTFFELLYGWTFNSSCKLNKMFLNKSAIIVGEFMVFFFVFTYSYRICFRASFTSRFVKRPLERFWFFHAIKKIKSY